MNDFHGFMKESIDVTEVEIYDNQVNILRKHQEYCHVYGVTIDGFWIDDRIYWTA
jgi:hypothetical protein